jgi:hypothetical protein
MEETGMRTLADSIIGEYFDNGFVEALISLQNANRPGLRVCVRVHKREDLPDAIGHADSILPSLIADMAAVESMATEAVGSLFSAVVFDIWIDRDGASSYTCGFFDGEAEDTLVGIRRSEEGKMTLE